MKDQTMELVIQQLVEKGVRYDAAAQDFEKTYITRVLERAKGNQSRAARLLGMHRNTLSRKINEYSLTVDYRAHNGNGNGNGNGNALHPVPAATGRATVAAAPTPSYSRYGRR